MSGSIPAWAYRGAKVICIKRGEWRSANGTPARKGFDRPVFGETYTIRDVDTDFTGGCIRLEEIVNPPAHWSDGFYEVRFNLSRFRPLITQQDDISTHFAQYLNAPHKPVREGV